MASEENARVALERYLSRQKDPPDELTIGVDFETGNIRAKIRHNKETWFCVLIEDVYLDLPDEPASIEMFLEKTMNVFPRMKGTNRDRAFWITLNEDGKIGGRYEPLVPH